MRSSASPISVRETRPFHPQIPRTSHPDAFTYVLLTPHDFPVELNEITTRQGRMLMTMLGSISQARVPPLTAELGLSHFTGLMLNVPKLINEGLLTGPASSFTCEVVAALMRVFAPESKGSIGPQTDNPDGLPAELPGER